MSGCLSEGEPLTVAFGAGIEGAGVGTSPEGLEDSGMIIERPSVFLFLLLFFFLDLGAERTLLAWTPIMP